MNLIELSERPTLTPVTHQEPTPAEQLQKRLQGRGWIRREQVARELGWSVRAVRDAASASGGAILGGNQGLKLTAEATDDEVDECVGRFRSQISEMTRRIVEIRATQGILSADVLSKASG